MKIDSRHISRHIAGAAALVLAAAAPFAQAANLVANGDFETGDLSAWVLGGDTSFIGVDPFAAHGGSFGAFFGSEAATTISQQLATAGGGAYQVEFWLELQDSATPSSFSWSWNGVVQAPLLVDAAGFGYAKFSAVVSAAGPTSTLSFSLANPNSFWLLDDVSVAAVPEPPAALLAAAGALWLAALRRRRAG